MPSPTRLRHPVAVQTFRTTTDDQRVQYHTEGLDYQSATFPIVKWNRAIYRQNQTITLLEVTGLTAYQIELFFSRIPHIALASPNETIQIANQNPELYEIGRLYSLGMSNRWMPDANTCVYQYLDYNVGSTGVEGKSSHAHYFSIKGDEWEKWSGQPLPERSFVLVIGDASHLQG